MKTMFMREKIKRSGPCPKQACGVQKYSLEANE